MINKSFTLRVLTISFIVLALPLLVYAIVFSQITYNRSIADVKEELKKVANLRTFSLAEVEQSVEILLEAFEHLFDLTDKVENLDSASLNQQLADIAHLGGDFKIYILEPGKDYRYKILASSVPFNPGEFFISHQKIRELEKSKTASFVRSLYSKEEESFTPYIFVAEKIESEKGDEPVGVIMIAMSMKREFNAILFQTEEEDPINFAILNPEGIVLTASQAMMRGNYFDPLSEERRKKLLSGELGISSLASHPLPIIETEGPAFFEFIFEDTVHIGYQIHFPKIGISVIAYASKEIFFSQVIRQFLIIYIIFGLIIIVGGAMSYWLAHWISRPLKHLSDVMGEVSQGNLNVRFQEEPLGLEINILGTSFNHTLDNLLENIQRAEDERVKKETYEHELAITHEAQLSLLPSEALSLKGFELAGTYIAAKQVGGNSGSWIVRKNKAGDEIVIIEMGDASGMGFSSCLYALSVRSLVHAHATLQDDIGDILSKINNTFLKDTGETGMFMTLVLSMYCPNTRQLSYYSCGHVPPIVRRENGQLITLKSSGIALGLLESKGYKTDSIQLDINDSVIFFTDGLLEVVNEKNQPFSEERLKNCLKKGEWKSAQEIVEGLTDEINTFTGSMPQEEDLSIIVLRISSLK